MLELEIQLFAPFHVTLNKQATLSKSWKARQAHLLLGMLALSERQHITRSQALNELWPGRRETCFDDALHTLREQLSQAPGNTLSGKELVLRNDSLFFLNTEVIGVGVDVLAFEAPCRDLVQSKEVGALVAYLESFQGIDSAFTEHHYFQRFVPRVNQALSSVVAHCITYLLPAQLTEARRIFRRYHEDLAAWLPSKQFEAIVSALATRQPKAWHADRAQRAAKPSITARGWRERLEATFIGEQPTPFIGRDDLLQAIGMALKPSALIVITGLGGRARRDWRSR